MNSQNKTSKIYSNDHLAITAGAVMGVGLAVIISLVLTRHLGLPSSAQGVRVNQSPVGANQVATTTQPAPLPVVNSRIERAQNEALAAQTRIDLTERDIAAAQGQIQGAMADRDSINAQFKQTQTVSQRRFAALMAAEAQLKPVADKVTEAQQQANVIRGSLQAHLAHPGSESFISARDLKAAEASALDEQSDLAQGQMNVQTRKQRLQDANATASGLASQQQAIDARLAAAMARRRDAEARLPLVISEAKRAQQVFSQVVIQESAKGNGG